MKGMSLLVSRPLDRYPLPKKCRVYAHQRIAFAGITGVAQSPSGVTYVAPRLEMALGATLTKRAPLSGWKVLYSMHLLQKALDISWPFYWPGV